MSKIGKQPITIPEMADLKIEEGKVTVTGPKGEMILFLPSFLVLKKEGSHLILLRLKETKEAKSIHGTFRSLISNALLGVTNEWFKELEIVGTGYQASLSGNDLVLKLGFSHPVVFSPPAGIRFELNENRIKVLGFDKELVGNIAAKIRKIKKVDPYKGKGIRYLNESIKIKPGKAVKSGTTGG